MTRRILSDIATHPWPFAGFVASAVATVLLLADLGRDMTVLVGVVAAVVAGVVVVTGRMERAL